MRHPFRYLSLSKPKTVLTAPREAPQLGFKGFSFATPAHPVSLNTTILIPVATNRGAPDHNHRFANGSKSDRRGFLSNSEQLSHILRFFRDRWRHKTARTPEFRSHEAVLSQETATNRRQTQGTSSTEPSFASIDATELWYPNHTWRHPREKPPEARPTSRPRPITHRIETGALTKSKRRGRAKGVESQGIGGGERHAEAGDARRTLAARTSTGNEARAILTARK